ncbi:MAG: acyl-CoA dehydrogenase family protein [Gammaproteobacteria bacterium]|nr:acyl-CoA dehydrogenase family protein [Gammaproteobacteria bacterium]
MDTRRLLVDSAERIFSDYCDMSLWDLAENGVFPTDLWRRLEENGFHELAMKDGGTDLGDAFAVLKVAGSYAVPLPLSEILLGNRWLGSSDNLPSVGLHHNGHVVEVPWGREVKVILGLCEGTSVVTVVRAKVSLDLAVNLAGEPRDKVVSWENEETLTLDEDPYTLLALARVVQMAGGIERVLDLSLQYANEREQFGRPIARFQAIQHNLAVLAGETAAATRAADAAVDAIGDERFALEVAAAKSRVGETVGVVAEIAHQIHGAMGFAHEHQLHHFTRRLWAWRDEFGNEFAWQQRLGQELCDRGADGLWDFLATRG